MFCSYMIPEDWSDAEIKKKKKKKTVYIQLNKASPDLEIEPAILQLQSWSIDH